MANNNTIKDDQAKQALEKLLEMFKNDQAPAVIARTMIRRATTDAELPSDFWSLGNQIIMLLNGTEDARGFKQWQEVGRRVKKGAKAFYILAPMTKKMIKKEEDPQTGEKQEIPVSIITGFRGIPVFKLEDTEGDPLPDRAPLNYMPEQLPHLINVAEAWGINIKYLPSKGNYYGCTDGKHNIKLCTYEEKTFYHELSHCAHSKIIGGLKGGQRPNQEIVAEFSAAVLAEMYGGAMHGNSWQYIKNYSGDDPAKALKNILSLLNEIEQVISLILDTAKISQSQVA